MQRFLSLVFLLGVLLVSMSADAFILLMPTTPSALAGAPVCTVWVESPNDNYGNLNIPTANTVWVNVGC
jgi:hypothetical protein